MPMPLDYLQCNMIFIYDYGSTLYSAIGDGMPTPVLCLLLNDFFLC